MSNKLSTGMREKVTSGKSVLRNVLRLSGKFNEITNKWMISDRLLTKDNRKFSSACSKKLITKPTAMIARTSLTA